MVKTALITGSTSGIGLVIAKKLAIDGYNIMLNGLADIDQINQLKASLSKKYQVKVAYHGADLADELAIEELINYTNQQLGKIDLLVNNAGIQHVAAIDQFSNESWNKIIAINLTAAFCTIKATLPIMKKNNFGRIVNIASVHGLVASKYKSAYVAAKHGLVGLTKVVALETAELNITCNAICPGWVKTPLVEQQINQNALNDNISIEQATKNLLFEKQPSLKFALAEEIAELVKFLASKEINSITGTALPIDGAWTAR